MEDSRTVKVYLENGDETCFAVEVEHPDEDGDVCMRIWRSGHDAHSLYIGASCARAIARALLEAAN